MTFPFAPAEPSLAHSRVGTDPNRIIIFDTTLRDGEQSPGCSMTQDEKLRLAAMLEEMGVDVIEAGYPAASPGDFAAVQAIAQASRSAVIAGLARARPHDIERAAEALAPCPRRRIHTFIATSPLHRQYKLKMSQEQVLDAIHDSVTLARRFTDDVEWSAEDSGRTEIPFLIQAVTAAIRAGARTINLPDTVGYTLPEEYAARIRAVREAVPDADSVIFSVHCHNDLGLAVANSLAGVMAGARQIECTINGIGERAGNAALEEVVMAMRVRRDLMPYTTGIRTERLVPASHLLSATTGFSVQPNKAIVGANAFAHEAGIHQDGMLKNAETYEIMTPDSVGLKRSSLVLGKHSGRNAFRSRLEEMGYALSDNQLEDAFQRFKDLADRKKTIFDEDLIALVDDQVLRDRAVVDFVSLRASSSSDARAEAVLSLLVSGEKRTALATGNGPFDAAFAAIREIVPHTAELALFQIHAITAGSDAQAEVTVRLAEDGITVNGQGSEADTVVAAVRAYLHALNKLLTKRERAQALQASAAAEAAAESRATGS